MGIRTPASLHLPKHVPAKNAPHFTLPDRDTPKTHPVLGLNLRRCYFRGVCFCAPTRIRAKFGEFHIPARVPTKNAPDFILSNKDAPKTRPVLGLDLRRGAFRGVCFCALHGYMKNLAGFGLKPSARGFSGRMLLRPYTGTCKIWRVSHFLIRIHRKRTPFHPSQ